MKEGHAMAIRRTCSMYVFAGVLAALVAGHALAQAADDAATVKDFQGRVAKYLEVHKATGVANKPSDSPNKLADQKQLAEEKIREARPAAKQGDIFAPPIGAYFKKQIAATLQGPEGAKVRASLRRAEPLPNLRLEVNEKYPQNLPLQSTPPTLLLNLPRLPGELQYRIVGSTLVLYDTASNLVVDLLPGAVPAS
jgi:hypothetical protein